MNAYMHDVPELNREALDTLAQKLGTRPPLAG
jgi:hypothetical protein